MSQLHSKTCHVSIFLDSLAEVWFVGTCPEKSGLWCVNHLSCSGVTLCTITAGNLLVNTAAMLIPLGWMRKNGVLTAHSKVCGNSRVCDRFGLTGNNVVWVGKPTSSAYKRRVLGADITSLLLSNSHFSSGRILGFCSLCRGTNENILKMAFPKNCFTLLLAVLAAVFIQCHQGKCSDCL